MDDLIELIQNTLGIPCISENEAVLDGSFCISPYFTDGLIGDGCVASVTNYYTVDIFYEDKKLLVVQTIALWKLLNSKNKYCCQSPDYTYEQNAEMWHAVVRAQEVSND